MKPRSPHSSPPSSPCGRCERGEETELIQGKGSEPHDAVEQHQGHVASALDGVEPRLRMNPGQKQCRGREGVESSELPTEVVVWTYGRECLEGDQGWIPCHGPPTRVSRLLTRPRHGMNSDRPCCILLASQPERSTYVMEAPTIEARRGDAGPRPTTNINQRDRTIASLLPHLNTSRVVFLGITDEYGGLP